MRRHRYSCVASVLLFFASCSPASEPKTSDTPAPAEPTAQDMISGTWVLNLSKSTYSPADLTPKSGTVKYELLPDGTIHGVTEGVNSKGLKTHSEYTAKLGGPTVPSNATVDGKPNPEVDGVAWKKVDDHTYEIQQSLKGQAVYDFRIVIAHDGKTRTSTQTGKNAKGQAVNNTQFYDKQ